MAILLSVLTTAKKLPGTGFVPLTVGSRAQHEAQYVVGVQSVLAEWLADASPDTPLPKLVSPATSVKHTHQILLIFMLLKQVSTSSSPSPTPRRARTPSHVMCIPQPGTVPCTGIGAGHVFVELMKEKGDRI